MAIGRIASLIGSLAPGAAAEPAQADATREARTAEASGGTHDRNHRQSGDAAGMVAQIEQILSAIRQLHENASQDGAGMALSPSGTTLKGSVTALGHLLATARDTRTALPRPLIDKALDVVGSVEGGLGTIPSAVEDRTSRMAAADADRVRALADRFVGEMQAAIGTVRTALGR
ncbi:MAG: hypothetical protein ACM33T_08550 [Solirubrobacterales bacterium]